MNRTQKLNARFGVGEKLFFRQLGDEIVSVEIETPLAKATISLHGGHVVKWWPKHQQTPVLWVSKLSNFAADKAIRGGVPICWPWFGAHPSNSKLPNHGYARISAWDVTATEVMNDGTARIDLTMKANEIRLSHWPHSVRLSVRIIVGKELTIELITTNENDQDIVITEGFHTYFKVGDINNVRVLGLEGVEYLDLIRDKLRCIQEGPVVFNAELGRFYLKAPASCVIEDPTLNRRIFVEKKGSLSTVVWNPWTDKASKMVDLGVDGWQDMVCVEGVNAFENAVTISAGSSHSHKGIYCVEYMK
jgi:D-hexose-6-phosphate mutarotase